MLIVIKITNLVIPHLGGVDSAEETKCGDHPAQEATLALGLGPDFTWKLVDINFVKCILINVSPHPAAS